MNYPDVIAVTAPSRSSGKGTISNVLTREYGYSEIAFAMPIKCMYMALLMYQGVPTELYPRILDGDLKETPMAEVAGLSLRTFAEGVGTDWGRKLFDEDMWIKMATIKIITALKEGKRVVCSDVRFANECDVVRDRGGVVWSVVRPLANGGLVPSLSSEGHLREYWMDREFYNFGSINDLEDLVRDEMVQYEGEQEAGGEA